MIPASLWYLNLILMIVLAQESLLVCLVILLKARHDVLGKRNRCKRAFSNVVLRQGEGKSSTALCIGPPLSELVILGHDQEILSSTLPHYPLHQLQWDRKARVRYFHSHIRRARGTYSWLFLFPKNSQALIKPQRLASGKQFLLRAGLVRNRYAQYISKWLIFNLPHARSMKRFFPSLHCENLLRASRGRNSSAGTPLDWATSRFLILKACPCWVISNSSITVCTGFHGNLHSWISSLVIVINCIHSTLRFGGQQISPWSQHSERNLVRVVFSLFRFAFVIRTLWKLPSSLHAGPENRILVVLCVFVCVFYGIYQPLIEVLPCSPLALCQ